MTQPVEIKDEYRITQNDPNVTVNPSVVATRTMVAEYIGPDSTVFVIRPGDVLSCYFESAPAADDCASNSRVELVRTDPNGIVTRQIVDVSYRVVSNFTDRNMMYTIGQRIEIRPRDRLQIWLTEANAIMIAASTEFQISGVRGAIVRY